MEQLFCRNCQNERTFAHCPANAKDIYGCNCGRPAVVNDGAAAAGNRGIRVAMIVEVNSPQSGFATD